MAKNNGEGRGIFDGDAIEATELHDAFEEQFDFGKDVGAEEPRIGTFEFGDPVDEGRRSGRGARRADTGENLFSQLRNLPQADPGSDDLAGMFGVADPRVFRRTMGTEGADLGDLGADRETRRLSAAAAATGATEGVRRTERRGGWGIPTRVLAVGAAVFALTSGALLGDSGGGPETSGKPAAAVSSVPGGASDVTAAPGEHVMPPASRTAETTPQRTHNYSKDETILAQGAPQVLQTQGNLAFMNQYLAAINPELQVTPNGDPADPNTVRALAIWADLMLGDDETAPASLFDNGALTVAKADAVANVAGVMPGAEAGQFRVRKDLAGMVRLVGPAGCMVTVDEAGVVEGIEWVSVKPTQVVG